MWKVTWVVYNLIRADGQKNAFFRYSHARAHQCFEIGFVSVLSKACHLASGCHFYSEHYVSSCKIKREVSLSCSWYLNRLRKIQHVPAKREKENWGTFTPTLSQPRRTSTGSTRWPTITLVAMAIKSCSNVLETKGNERDTLKLHSMTLNSLSCLYTHRRIRLGAAEKI